MNKQQEIEKLEKMIQAHRECIELKKAEIEKLKDDSFTYIDFEDTRNKDLKDDYYKSWT